MTLERPILFSGEMVRAILDGRKTQTRRVVKPQPQVELFPFIGRDNQPTGEFAFVDSPRVISKHMKCPYGTVGSRLWVREIWCHYGDRTIYRANYGNFTPISDGIGGPWKSPIHMKRSDSRLTLEIQSVRVERIQDISEEDCEAEGIDDAWLVKNHVAPPRKYSFKDLWDEINDKPKYVKGAGFGGETARFDSGNSWAENPWVWCLTFKVLKDAEEVGRENDNEAR